MNWIKLLDSICVYSRTTTIANMPQKVKTALLPGRYCREVTEQGYVIKEALTIFPGQPDSDKFKVVRSIYILQPDGQTPVNYQEEEWKASYKPYEQELSLPKSSRKYFFIPEQDLLVAGTCLYKKTQGVYTEDDFIANLKKYAL